MVPFSNLIGSIYAAFNAADESYAKPNLYGKPVWFADLDGRYAQPGDYLVRVPDGDTWFIADLQQNLPIVAIECNARISVQRQSVSTTCGELPYSGLQNPSDILGNSDSRWPASILMGGRALGAIGLPADVKEGGWRILLPPSIPRPIQSGDLITDDLDRRFAVESAELTGLGWRLTVNEVHA